MEETDRNRVVLAYIVLDNLQELTQFVRANYRATANIIEETLTGWVASMHGMIREYDRDKYLALFSEEMLDRCVQDNFSILGKIMNIRVGDNTFPLSVSMGIADIDGSMEERDRAANAALDMALQRGGNRFGGRVIRVVKQQPLPGNDLAHARSESRRAGKPAGKRLRLHTAQLRCCARNQ